VPCIDRCLHAVLGCGISLDLWVSTALVGMLGLLVGMIHGDPIYTLTTMLGIVESGIVVRGKDQLYIALLGALVWAPIYGALGWGIDLWRKRRISAGNTA
jgi:hypothetical protein